MSQVKSPLFWPLLVIGMGVLFTPTTDFAVTSNPTTLLSTHWERALAESERGNRAVAVTLFEDWIGDAAKIGIYSREAHMNLSALYRHLEKKGPAIFEWLKGVQLDDSPISLWSTISQLSQYQRESDIPTATNESTLFLLHMLLRNSVIILFLVLAFWALALAVGIYYHLGHRSIGAGKLFFGLSLSFAIVSFGLWGVHKSIGFYGVLSNDHAAVPLFSQSNRLPEHRLSELPSGTIVTLGEWRLNSVEVLAPRAGWVRSDHLLALR